MLNAYKDNLRMTLTEMSKYVYAERLKCESLWNRENKHWVGIYHKESGKLAGLFKFIVGEPMEDTAYPEEIHFDEGYNKLLALELKVLDQAFTNQPKLFEDDLAMLKLGAFHLTPDFKPRLSTLLPASLHILSRHFKSLGYTYLYTV